MITVNRDALIGTVDGQVVRDCRERYANEKIRYWIARAGIGERDFSADGEIDGVGAGAYLAVLTGGIGSRAIGVVDRFAKSADPISGSSHWVSGAGDVDGGGACRLRYRHNQTDR